MYVVKNWNAYTGMWYPQQIHRIIVNMSSFISQFVWERVRLNRQ